MSIPIPTLHLFPLLDQKLIQLLRSLHPGEWERPTPAGQWRVEDIAAHLLDGNLRTVSIFRDQYVGDPPVSGEANSYKELVSYLNRLNTDWVKSFKRVSPDLLIELLEITGVWFVDCLKKSDPLAPSLFPVDWAGEKESENWFHVAREFTEKWHHLQQIREAVSQQGIMTKEFCSPLMRTFMRALPYHYRTMTAAEESVVVIHITGSGEGIWSITRKNKSWEWSGDSAVAPHAQVVLDTSIAWKLFTKAVRPADAFPYVEIKGNEIIGRHLLDMVAVIA